MTTATETAPQDLTYWVETDEHLARNQAAGLRNLAAMVEAFPDIAPLLRVMLASLINPVDVTDSHAALERLISAAAQSAGVAVSDAVLGGVVVQFGPAVGMWNLPFTMPEAEAAIESVPESPVVEAAPVAHDEVPDDEPETEPQDDADPLAETAAFDTATEVTTP